MAAQSPVLDYRPVPRWRKILPNYLFILPYFLFFFLFRVGPDLYGFWVSFHNWDILLPDKPFIGFGNYAELYNDDLWWVALRNTILFSVFTVAGNVIVGLLAAVFVNQKPPGQHFFRFVFYTPVVISVAVMGVVLNRVFNTEYGLLNYYLAWIGIDSIPWLATPSYVIPVLSGATVWWTFGFPFLIFLAGLLNIPNHLYEAAVIDGANGVQSFFSITVPLLKPVMLFVVVTQFIAHLKVFGQMFLMTQGGPGHASYSVVMYLYDIGWRFFRMGYASSLAFSLAIIILFVTLINFKLLGGRVEY